MNEPEVRAPNSIIYVINPITDIYLITGLSECKKLYFKPKQSFASFNMRINIPAKPYKKTLISVNKGPLSVKILRIMTKASSILFALKKIHAKATEMKQTIIPENCDHQVSYFGL